MILNERILKIVLTLSEELHFGRTAARLHISQGALSGTVKNLECDLGVCLFRRTSRRVELTEAGCILATEARQLIEHGERVVTMIRERAPEVRGPLRIGYTTSLDLRWLCSLISHVHTSLNSSVQLVSTEAVHLDDDILKGILHAALYAGRLRHPDLQSMTLFRESLRVVLGSKHRLAQCKTLEVAQLADEPVVWLTRAADPQRYDSFMALCSSLRYRPKIVQEVRTLHECLEFARAGAGITFLPSFMQSNENDNAVLFLSLPALYAEYGLAYRRSNMSRDLARFVKFVQDSSIAPLDEYAKTND
jgi:DNA-binding transcriptional LysR family regulator